MKARNLQIEFVRVETMPGGGKRSRRFARKARELIPDCVGQSSLTIIGTPVTVWQAPQGKEWDIVPSVSDLFRSRQASLLLNDICS